MGKQHPREWWRHPRLWENSTDNRSIVEQQALENLLRESRARRIKRRSKLPKSVWDEFMMFPEDGHPPELD